jgi:hypothetical protein
VNYQKKENWKSCREGNETELYVATSTIRKNSIVDDLVCVRYKNRCDLIILLFFKIFMSLLDFRKTEELSTGANQRQLATDGLTC